MKIARFGICVAFLASLPVAQALPPAPKVQITAQLKHGEEKKGPQGGVGTRARKVEKVSYALTLKNLTFKGLENLEVAYILFVERQKLGEKKTNDPDLERVKGSLQVETLSRSPQAVNTEEVSLKTENLVGGSYYPDGGRVRAEDSVKGIWVRVTQNGEIVGEYAMPSTLTKRGWD